MEEDRVADKEEIIQEMRSLISNQASSSHVNNNVNNQNLQVMCLTARDDLLDILQESSGQFKMKSKEALTFIKGCAISRLAGDCRLIERIYIKRPYPALMYGNKSKTQFVYYNEKKERTVETNARVIAKMLADNAQRSYLKGSSSMKDSDGEWISANEDHPLIPMTDPYDKQIWNSHIYELNDQMYQKKLLNSIRIPFESEVLKGNHEI